MWAARVHALGSEPALEEHVPEPRPAAGETLVAVEAAAVGHLDLTIAAGAFPVHPPLPYVPGTDAAGRVLESPSLPVGTRVFVRGAGVGMELSGCWATRIAVPSAAVHPLPEEIDPVTGATFFVPCSTAHVALFVAGRLEAGERVAVRGAAGAVGSAAVQLARAGGAREVLAIVRGGGGALPMETALVDGEPAAIAALGADGGVDLLVDTVGGELLGTLVDVMRPGGRIVLVGYLAGREAKVDLTRVIGRDVRLLPANQLVHQEAMLGEAPALLERIADGELHVRATAFPFDRLADALEAVRTAGGGRVAVTMS
jgi:NADPH2:quinone reductase